jgi:chromosome segregation protein
MLRLQKLELNGFKSFSSPTEFVFASPLTAVVGPNGCGKSNIADALNWVIGEQSTKSLRAEHMGDVIFNGSDARKPVGMAEVTLHLLDTGGNGILVEAPAPSNGGSNGDAAPADDGEDGAAAHARTAAASREILITRRLFRSGDSEYMIDGHRSRLRDVQELLAEIRVGSGIYAVIGQGKVDSVLLSRPRDRRVLIEEAAGIAFYKIRKRQAQTKLEATEANLLRINDIVGELERQINSMKRQAARARRYARLNAEIDRAERILFHQESVRMEAGLAELRGRRAGLETAEAEAAAGIARADAALEGSRVRLSEASAAHVASRDRLHALDRSLDLLRAGVDRSREKETEALARISRGETETATLTARVADLEQRETAVAREAAEAASEAARAGAAHAEAETTARLGGAALQSVETALEAAREELVASNGSLADLRNEQRRITDALERAGSERGRLEILGAEIESERRSLIEKKELHARGKLQLVGAFGDAQGSVTKATEALRVAEALRESLLLEREEKRGRLAAAAERLTALRALDGATREAGPEEAAITGNGVLKDLLDPPEHLDRAVDAALRGILRGSLVSSMQEAAAIIAGLKEGGRSRAVLIPMDAPAGAAPERVPPGGAVLGTLGELLHVPVRPVGFLAPLLERVVVLSDWSAAIEARGAFPGRDLVTLQGDFLSTDGWLEGGAELPEEAGVMTLKRLIERLVHDEAASRDRIASLDGEIEAAAGAVSDARSSLEFGRARAAALEREMESVRLREETIAQEWARHELRIEAQGGERARLDEDSAALLAARDRIEALVREAWARQDELLRVAESLAGVADAARAGLRARGGRVAELAAVSAAARERRAAAEADAARHKEVLSETRSRLAAETEEIEGWRGRLGEARARLAADTEELSNLMAGRILAEGEVASAEALVIELRQALTPLEGAVRDARRILDEARQRLHEHALEEERLAGDRRNLEARVLERGFPSLEVALADLTDEERARDPESVRTLMSDLKSRREAMGAVNLMAVEQFQELEQRYAFITAQRRDLEESIRSLKETIARINRQSRERFMDAFEKVRGHFGEIFKTLFGGGRADLRLAVEGEGEDDVLEAGLEITAQPPGKRLQSISLLSGGEKALTAIALIFAIFKYSPSPFCLLDEVDAPLDEANVLRFNALLRSMSEETQFITITHNRRTMEAADVLYGVTMEEPGVSRTVSVVMGTEEDRREASRTLPGMLASRHRGGGRRTGIPPSPRLPEIAAGAPRPPAPPPRDDA